MSSICDQFILSVSHIVDLIIIIVHSFSYSLIYGFRYVLAFRFEKRRILCLRRFFVEIWFFVFPSVVLSCGRPCHIFALSDSSSGQFFRYCFIFEVPEKHGFSSFLFVGLTRCFQILKRSVGCVEPLLPDHACIWFYYFASIWLSPFRFHGRHPFPLSSAFFLKTR